MLDFLYAALLAVIGFIGFIGIYAGLWYLFNRKDGGVG